MNRKYATDKAPDRLRRVQQRFAAHLRNPEANAAPDDVEERRMEVYRGLFFRNIRGLLAGNFPVTRKLFSAERWDALVRDFYDRHRARTPLFPEIPREFLQYLQEQRGEQADDPPFLLELAHYEWVELALSLDEQELADVRADREGDLLRDIPVLSPLAWPLSYRFPVHEIRPDFQPREAPEQPTHLLVYRNRRDQVKFMRLNAVSALLIQMMKQPGSLAGVELLNRIADTLEGHDRDVVMAGGRQLLEDLAARDVVLGTRPKADTASEREEWGD